MFQMTGDSFFHLQSTEKYQCVPTNIPPMNDEYQGQ